ncbi:MAG: ferrochelatase [Methanomassiliicoccales archaeon]
MRDRMDGVIVSAYGSPSGLRDVEAYYTNILRGRKPSPAMLEELTQRYAAIGGRSPLNEITFRQAGALNELLSSLGREMYVEVGMKYCAPFIGDALEKMRREGVRRAVMLPLTPYNSTVSADSYVEIARRYVNQNGIELELTVPPSWHLNEHFLEYWERETRKNLKTESEVIFTAHSIPQKYDRAGEPYTSQIREVAGEIAKRLEIGYTVAFQSAGRTGEEWVGPDLLETLKTKSDAGAGNVLIVPIGFVSEHLEVLYDIDIEAKKYAEERGMKLTRTRLPNDDPLFIKALADAVLAAVY